jgi:hypothetical protein
MVMAKLHIICGNCGANDWFKWKYHAADIDSDEGVDLLCENCSTIHQLSDNATPPIPPGEPLLDQ